MARIAREMRIVFIDLSFSGLMRFLFTVRQFQPIDITDGHNIFSVKGCIVCSSAAVGADQGDIESIVRAVCSEECAGREDRQPASCDEASANEITTLD